MKSKYDTPVLMKIPSAAVALAVSVALLRAAAGGTESPARTAVTESSDEFDAPKFELATESAYLVGTFGNPNSYEVGAQFVTARLRWGAIHHENSFLRGYSQVYFLTMAEPIFRGPENYYYAISTGFRYNFVQRGSRFIPYFSGGVGLGWIDSHADVYGAQGQDFTFNILTAAGVSYKLNHHWKANAGILYQHLSNAGQTDPNPSLNLFGPQLGITYAW
jgi:opacity protein-like surface antigen